MSGLTLWGALKGAARTRPDHPYLIGEEPSTDLTYAALVSAGAGLGRTLGRSVGPGKAAAVLAATPEAWAVLWAASQAAGTVTLCLDPSETDEALRSRWIACGRPLVLADAPMRKRLSSWSESPRVLGPEDSDPAGVDAISPLESGPAMVFYTSGTTGESLGVTLSHRGLLGNAAAVCRALALGADDRTLSPLAPHHIYGFSVLLCHLLERATVVPENAFLYPQRTLERLKSLECTGFSGVAFHYRTLLERTDLARCALPSLRYWTQAGEAMPVELTRGLLAAQPRVRLHLMYGQTEASPRITMLDPPRAGAKPGSVGSPLEGVRLRIVDEEGREVPEGRTGEVVVGGEGVMLGYWDRPERTADVLKDGQLRTGDLGYLDADGDLYLTGRLRRFLKVGGRRVVPEEIERVLSELPGIRECAVLAWPDEVLGERPLAVIAGEGLPPTEQVMERCRARLAPHQVPVDVVALDKLSRAASGKIDWAGVRRLVAGRVRKKEVR